MSYVSNSPAGDEGGGYNDRPTVDDDYLKIFILPSWIYKAFTAKFNLVEIHEYAKLRQVVSVSDVAQLEILRNKLFGNSMSAATGAEQYYAELESLVYPGWRSLQSGVFTEDDMKEIRGTIGVLINDPQTTVDALSRLKEPEASGSCCVEAEPSFGISGKSDAPIPYKVVVVNDSLYIIVEEGFLSHVVGKENHQAFLTQVLKSAYGVAPIGVVNRSVFYRQYIDALAS